MCQVQVSLCWQKHQKFWEMGSCFLFMSLGALSYKGVFVQFSFFIKVLFWNFARSAFIMVLQRNWMIWKKVDNTHSLHLEHGLFSFCLPVWFFPNELMVKWVNVKGRWSSDAEMFPHLSQVTSWNLNLQKCENCSVKSLNRAWVITRALLE